MRRKPSTSSGDTVLTAASCAAAESHPAVEKLTMRAPVPLRNARRSAEIFSISPSSNRAGGALDRAQDADMRPTSAKIIGQFLGNLFVARLVVLVQEGRRLHDHAIDAVSALHGLLVDKRLLHSMGLFGCA